MLKTALSWEGHWIPRWRQETQVLPQYLVPRLWVAIELRIVHLEDTCGVPVKVDVGLALSVVRASCHLVLQSVTGQGNCILRTVIGPETGRLRQPQRHRHGDDQPTPVVVRLK